MMKKKRSIKEIGDDCDGLSGDENEPKEKVNKSTPHERDEVQRIFYSGDKIITFMSWNVNGMKALVNSNLPVLRALLEKHKPALLCLQEIKLQTDAVDEYKDIFPEYSTYWHCSTTKKGYAGTAVLIRKDIQCKVGLTSESTIADSSTSVAKKKQSKLTSLWKKADPKTDDQSTLEPLKVDKFEGTTVEKISYDFEDEGKLSQFSGEGRTITVEFDKFIFICCYVPNSGEGLRRLDYRVDEWDPYMRKYLQTLGSRKPVIFAGDMNVGHLDIDIHNPTAKHIAKQAGLTPRERASFSQLLATPSSLTDPSSRPFVDAFRYFHPNAKGQFTYWSQRTFARKDNRGLRLDYFVCSGDLFPPRSAASDDVAAVASPAASLQVVDSFIVHDETVGCSDHCPIGLVVKLL
eukprot:gene30396-39636_t